MRYERTYGLDAGLVERLRERCLASEVDHRISLLAIVSRQGGSHQARYAHDAEPWADPLLRTELHELADRVFAAPDLERSDGVDDHSAFPECIVVLEIPPLDDLHAHCAKKVGAHVLVFRQSARAERISRPRTRDGGRTQYADGARPGHRLGPRECAKPRLGRRP